MFQKSTVLFIITLCALISGLQSVSHSISSSTYEGELNIESGPTVTANVSGTYVVKETKSESGSITRAWHGGSPPAYPHARSRTVVYGFGTVAEKISGGVGAPPSGTSIPEENRASRRIGTWGIRANGTGAYTKARLYLYNYQSKIVGGRYYWSAHDEGTYTRTSDAEIKANSYNYITGTGWVQAMPTTKVSEGNSFSWTIDHQYRCPELYCSSNRVINAHDAHKVTCSHCGDVYYSCYRNEAAHHEGNNPACSRNENTVSNNGGTISSNRGSSSSCYNNTNHNWCSDTGSCTTRSRRGVPGECGHNYCCCAPSGSPIYNGGTGGGTGGGGTGTGSSDTRVRCGHGNACSRGGFASSREAHKTTCPAGHRYYACSASGARFHANCRARGSGEVRCARGSWCRSGGWASSRNAHQTTCAAGHTYWSCSPNEVRRHRNCRSRS